MLLSSEPHEELILRTFLRLYSGKVGSLAYEQNPAGAYQILAGKFVTFEFFDAAQKACLPTFTTGEEEALDTEMLENLIQLFLSAEQANVTLAQQILHSLPFSESAFRAFLQKLYEARIAHQFTHLEACISWRDSMRMYEVLLEDIPDTLTEEDIESVSNNLNTKIATFFRHFRVMLY